MKKLASIALFIFVLSFNPLNLFGQFTLTVHINGLKSDDGQILLELTDGNGKKISGYFQTIKNKKCVLVISNLKPGNYSFRYFHDVNKNKKLDTNFIGMPIEGFGFSNDAKGKFGPPPLAKTIFAFSGDKSLTCTAIYL